MTAMEPITDISKFVEEADDEALLDVFFSDEITDAQWDVVYDAVQARDLIEDVT